jgi:photoactive yellow protein
MELTDAELDALPYGVVEMDLAGEVLRYNATESRYSGLSRERVLGRHFFRDVAPCSNNRHVAGRFEQLALDETLAYTFSLRMRPVPVTLRLLRSADSTRMFLLVRWT